MGTTRRQFLGRAGSAAIASSLASLGLWPRRTVAQEGGKKLATRKLGSTGHEVTEIGMGCMNMRDPALVNAALDAGINYLDTAYVYMRGRNEEVLGQVMKDRRDEAFLTEVREQRRSFEEAMDDDLDTHGALDALHAMSKAINDYVAERTTKGVLLKAYAVYRKLLDALGLFERRRVETSELAEKLIGLIVKAREQLRAERNYKLSDRMREDLAKIGVILGDKPGGTSWKIERC